LPAASLPERSGQNTIAMFTVDHVTGEPRLAQAIETHGFHPRTFSIDPNGRMLVVANLIELPVRDGDAMRTRPATLSTYKIGDDGRLTFVRSYDIETNGLLQFWGGFVGL
jgi:6-phosphogluconolactonase